MSSLLPPSPQGVPPGHAFWNVWYEKLRVIVNGLATSIAWTNLNFTGSKIEDIVSREHNKLQSFDGGTAGEYFHLTSAQHTGLTGGGSTALHAHANIGNLTMTSQAADPVLADIPSGVAKLYKNTTSSTVKLWVNDSGTLKSVTLV